MGLRTAFDRTRFPTNRAVTDLHETEASDPRHTRTEVQGAHARSPRPSCFPESTNGPSCGAVGRKTRPNQASRGSSSLLMRCVPSRYHAVLKSMSHDGVSPRPG